MFIVGLIVGIVVTGLSWFAWEKILKKVEINFKKQGKASDEEVDEEGTVEKVLDKI